MDTDKPFSKSFQDNIDYVQNLCEGEQYTDSLKGKVKYLGHIFYGINREDQAYKILESLTNETLKGPKTPGKIEAFFRKLFGIKSNKPEEPEEKNRKLSKIQNLLESVKGNQATLEKCASLRKIILSKLTPATSTRQESNHIQEQVVIKEYPALKQQTSASPKKEEDVRKKTVNTEPPEVLQPLIPIHLPPTPAPPSQLRHTEQRYEEETSPLPKLSSQLSSSSPSQPSSQLNSSSQPLTTASKEIKPINISNITNYNSVVIEDSDKIYEVPVLSQGDDSCGFHAFKNAQLFLQGSTIFTDEKDYIQFTTKCENQGININSDLLTLDSFKILDSLDPLDTESSAHPLFADVIHKRQLEQLESEVPAISLIEVLKTDKSNFTIKALSGSRSLESAIILLKIRKAYLEEKPFDHAFLISNSDISRLDSQNLSHTFCIGLHNDKHKGLQWVYMDSLFQDKKKSPLAGPITKEICDIIYAEDAAKAVYSFYDHDSVKGELTRKAQDISNKSEQLKNDQDCQTLVRQTYHFMRECGWLNYDIQDDKKINEAVNTLKSLVNFYSESANTSELRDEFKQMASQLVSAISNRSSSTAYAE